MNNWKWWNILDLNKFTALNVPDYYFQRNLQDLGLVDLVVMKGDFITVLFQGYLLTPRLNGRNGFSVEHKYSAMIDSNNNLWVGMKS